MAKVFPPFIPRWKIKYTVPLKWWQINLFQSNKGGSIAAMCNIRSFVRGASPITEEEVLLEDTALTPTMAIGCWAKVAGARSGERGRTDFPSEFTNCCFGLFGLYDHLAPPPPPPPPPTHTHTHANTNTTPQYKCFLILPYCS